MTTLLGASASLMIRVCVLALTAFLILALISFAAMAQDTLSVMPTGPAPVAEVPTITLWRDGAIMVGIMVLVALLVWRLTLIEKWVIGTVEFHGLASALMHDEITKRGLVKPEPAQPTLALDEDDLFAAQANKVAPPPPPAPTPRRVTPRLDSIPPSTKAVAATFAARRAAKGETKQ